MKESVTSILNAITQSLITFIDKLGSKKFFVWIVATHLTYGLILDPQSWLFVSLLYLGIEGGLDWKGLNPAALIAGRTTAATSTDTESD